MATVSYGTDQLTVQCEKAGDADHIADQLGTWRNSTDHLVVGCKTLVIYYQNGYRGQPGGYSPAQDFANAIANDPTLTITGRVFVSLNNDSAATVTP